jgi:hypothetical protein
VQECSLRSSQNPWDPTDPCQRCLADGSDLLRHGVGGYLQAGVKWAGAGEDFHANRITNCPRGGSDGLRWFRSGWNRGRGEGAVQQVHCRSECARFEGCERHAARFPQILWITRGASIWGREAALERFEALYQGTWSLIPKTDELKVFEVQPGVGQLYVPITFMIAPAGQTAQPARFLMNQIPVKTPEGWKVSSILPIPVPMP